MRICIVYESKLFYWKTAWAELHGFNEISELQQMTHLFKYHTLFNTQNSLMTHQFSQSPAIGCNLISAEIENTLLDVSIFCFELAFPTCPNLASGLVAFLSAGVFCIFPCRSKYGSSYWLSALTLISAEATWLSFWRIRGWYDQLCSLSPLWVINNKSRINTEYL